MTPDEIRKSEKPVLTPADIAPVLHRGPHAIRLIAKSKPESLSFPVTRIRSRTLIPREGFLNWMTGKEAAGRAVP